MASFILHSLPQEKILKRSLLSRILLVSICVKSDGHLPDCAFLGLWAAFNPGDHAHFIEIHFGFVSARRNVLPMHWLLLPKIFCQLVIFCLTSKCWSASWAVSLSPLHYLHTLHSWSPSLLSSVTSHVNESLVSLCSPVFPSAQDVYAHLSIWHHMHDQ